MDLALESLKEVIVLLRSSEIGNSGAISAKLPPSRFERDCFQIAADLPKPRSVWSHFKVVSKAPQCCGERCLVLKTALAQTIPAGLWQQQQGSCRHQQMVEFTGWDNCEGRKGGKVIRRGTIRRARENLCSNSWRHQGAVTELRFRAVEGVPRWGQRRSGLSLACQ